MSDPQTHSHDELATLLSHNLGMDKAVDLVGVAAGELGYGPAITMEQALEILERIAVQPGLVGVTARFAKSKVLLRWGAV